MAGMKPLKERLTIKEGMTLQEVKEKCNKAQMEARILFDSDGNGKYDENEAKMFNNDVYLAKKIIME